MFGVENMLNEMVRQQSNYPPLLYHYCKIDSAKYILDRDADIAARSVFRSPNDPAEYSYGIGLFLDYLTQKRLLPHKIVDILNANLIDNLVVGKINKSSIIPFVFCLTDAFNSSYHWDKFVDKEGGFCFVFSTLSLAEAIRNVVRDNKVSLRLEKCYYVGHDDEVINCVFTSICKDREDDLLKLELSHGDDAEAAKNLMTQVCSFASCIKGAKYSPEREWRIVMTTENSKQSDVNGYLQTGIKNHCPRGDILYLMRGIISSPTGDRDKLISVQRSLLDTRRGMVLA